jgi:hypothetical protein
MEASMSAHRNRLPYAAVAVLVTISSAVPARASGPDFTSMTLLATRPYAKDGVAHNEAPLYEQLSLLTPGSSVGPIDEMRLVARAWGRADLGDPLIGSRAQGDIDVAYLEGRLLERRLLLRAGRQMLTEGAARNTQLDGLTASGQVWRGLGVEAYGGAPVVARFGSGGIGNRGDALTGARIFWRQSYDAEVGVSYVYAVDSGTVARSDAAVDGWWQPIRTVTLGATAQWSLYEARLAEGRGLVQWQPIKIVQLTADVKRTAPDLFLARNSIFAVFSQQRRDEAGGEAALRLGSRLSAYLDYHHVWFKDQNGATSAVATLLDAGSGERAGGKLSWHLGPQRETTVGCEVRLLEEPDNGYKQARFWWMRSWAWGLRATVDADAYWLDHSITGQARSLAANATVGYPFAPGWDGMVGGSFGFTPFLYRRFELIARASYRFDLAGRKQ